MEGAFGAFSWGRAERAQPQPDGTGIVHGVGPLPHHPLTLSGLKYLPLSDAVSMFGFN